MKSFFISTTICVCALVIVLDLWLNLGHPLAHAPTASLDRGEIFTATQEYKKVAKAPDVVLLGSSLVTAPVMQADAILANQPISRFSQRNCEFLEAALAKKLDSHDPSTSPKIFCLAVGGEMVSDAYLIVKHVLDNKTPSAIIYGIAPRDFQDNIMPGVQSSETFHVLARVNDLPDLFQTANLTWEQKTNIFLERVWGLWRYHADIKTYLTLRAKKLLEACLPWVMFDKYGETLELKPRKRGQFPEEAIGVLQAFPNVAVEHTSAEAARFEYIRRYNPPNQKMIDAEFEYLQKLLALCSQRGTPVLLINMPLSQFNKSLMPKEFYTAYLNRLGSLSKAYDAEFVDLNKNPWDAEANFADTVHLSPAVSQKFLDQVAAVAAQSSVSIAIRKSNQSIAVIKQSIH
jgi:hypothetical protein